MAYAVVRGDQVIYARGFGYKDQAPASGTVDEHTSSRSAPARRVQRGDAGHRGGRGQVAWTIKSRADARLQDERPLGDPGVPRGGPHGPALGDAGYALDMMSLVGFGKATSCAPSGSWTRDQLPRQFRYQNNLHLWAAALIEKKTGLVWEEAVRQRILAPLGMSESTFDFAAYDANRTTRSTHLPVRSLPLDDPPDWTFRAGGDFRACGGPHVERHDMAKWLALQLGNGSYGGRRSSSLRRSRPSARPRLHVDDD